MVNTTGQETFNWKYFFPDYETFKQSVDQNSMIDYGEDESTLKYIYNVLTREYWNTNVCYTDPQSFIFDFFNIFDDYYVKIKLERERIAKIHALTDEELLVVNRSLNNFANHPNTEPSDPEKPLNYVSSQNYNVTNSDKLSAYLNALDRLPSYRAKIIIDTFQKLFINIYNKVTYTY